MNLDVRAENVIASGGGGTIAMAVILDPRLYKRTQRAQCVVKILNGNALSEKVM